MSSFNAETPSLDRSYWLQTVARALIAAALMVAVSLVGQRLEWPQQRAIAFGVFFFVAFATRPNRPGRHPRTLLSRLVSGLIAAVVATLVLAVLSNW